MKIPLFAFLALLLVSCAEPEPDIKQFRGQGRLGIYPETGLLDQWPEAGPEEVLRVEGLGHGFGSPTFEGEYFYLTGAVDSMLVVQCYSLDGTPVWKKELGEEWMSTFPGSRSAPTIAGDLIYTGSGMGDLYCLDREDGQVLWQRSAVDDFKALLPMHGHSEAPLIHGDRVFWTPGGKEFNAVALDRFSGDLLWSNKGFGERSGYNPGQLITLEERSIFVTFSAYHLMAFDAANGQLLWSEEQFGVEPEKRRLGMGDTHANAVLYHQGSIYYVAGDGNSGVGLSLSPDGAEITRVWQNKDFDGYMGGVILIDGHLYSTATKTRYLRSVRADNGQAVDSLDLGHGALIAAEGLLYYYNQRGLMSLISVNEGRMEVISSFRVKGGSMQHFAHPVIYRGRLYQRRGDAMMVYDISRPL